MRLYLTEHGGWDSAREQALLEACSTEIEAAAEAYLATPPQPPESMFDHLHETLPEAFASQRDQMAALGGASTGGDRD